MIMGEQTTPTYSDIAGLLITAGADVDAHDCDDRPPLVLVVVATSWHPPQGMLRPAGLDFITQRLFAAWAGTDGIKCRVVKLGEELWFRLFPPLFEATSPLQSGGGVSEEGERGASLWMRAIAAGFQSLDQLQREDHDR